MSSAIRPGADDHGCVAPYGESICPGDSKSNFFGRCVQSILACFMGSQPEKSEFMVQTITKSRQAPEKSWFRPRSYHYFDGNELKSKNLSVFQRILRRVFGCYAETHLLKVVDKAYEVTRQSCKEKRNSGDDEKILGLIYRAEKVYKKKIYGNIPLCKEGSSDRVLDVKTEMRYSIEKSEITNPLSKYKIKNIDFRVTIEKNTYNVLIHKDESEGLVVDLPQDVFGEKLQQARNDCTVGIIMTLLRAILRTSSRSFRGKFSNFKSFVAVPNGKVDSHVNQMKTVYWWNIGTRMFDEFATEIEFCLYKGDTIHLRELSDYRAEGDISIDFAVDNLEVL